MKYYSYKCLFSLLDADSGRKLITCPCLLNKLIKNSYECFKNIRGDMNYYSNTLPLSYQSSKML